MHWFHHYKPISVAHIVSTEWCSLRKKETEVGQTTKVLFKCACGRLKVEELNGRWRLEDLKQQTASPKVDAELNILRQMAGLKKK